MIVIVDYKMGNLASVKNSFNKLGYKPKISSRKSDIEKAGLIVLPGVGAFRDGISNLKKLDLDGILYKKVIVEKTPFIGICLGMQLLAKTGYEFGEFKGLGWLDAEVVKLSSNNKIRIPHVGWNSININEKKLFENIHDTNFYFTHSYHLKPSEKTIISASCNYGDEFVACVHKDNIIATQFHPEKSQKSGLQFLTNSLKMLKYAKD